MQFSKDRLITDILRFARAHRGKLTFTAFVKSRPANRDAVRRHFPAGFYSLLQAAGLEGRVAHRPGIPTDELLAEYHRIHLKLARRPLWHELQTHSRHSLQVFRRRFKTAYNLTAAYTDWKSRKLPAPTPSSPAANLTLSPRPASDHQDFPHGQPLSFRGHLFAPTHESGVLILFGTLQPELGFTIISSRPGFPDCLALRPSKATPGQWDLVRIEFELKASNFREHGHNHRKCDLIVCWENDWPEAPIPVMDLKTELRRIQQTKGAA